MPTLNGMFVLALRHGFRARAFGVMQGGLQLSQGGAVLVTGLLADRFPLPTVVGLWSVGGTVLMAVVASRWPTRGPSMPRSPRATASPAGDQVGRDRGNEHHTCRSDTCRHAGCWQDGTVTASGRGLRP